MSTKYCILVLASLAVVLSSVRCYPADEQLRRIGGAGTIGGPAPAAVAAVTPPVGQVAAAGPASLSQETLKTDSSYGYGYAYPYYGYYYPRYYAYGYGYPYYSYYSHYWGWPYYR